MIKQVSLKRLEIRYLCNYAMTTAYVLISCDLGFDAENVIEWREQTVTSRHVKGLVFRLVPKIKLRYYVSNQMCRL